MENFHILLERYFIKTLEKKGHQQHNTWLNQPLALAPALSTFDKKRNIHNNKY